MKQLNRSVFFLGAILALGALGLARETNPTTLAELMQRAAVIKPSAEELKWQRIPWLIDLGQAQRLSQQERRPIFLWVTGDDPLERC